jgi:hypothetical protein
VAFSLLAEAWGVNAIFTSNNEATIIPTITSANAVFFIFRLFTLVVKERQRFSLAMILFALARH